MPRYFHSTKLIVQLLILASLSFILSACGGSSSQAQTENGPRQTIRGNAVKGVIANGIVSVYQVSGEQAGPDIKQLIAQARTNALGEFNLSIPEQNDDAVILLELTSEPSSTMLCDLISGCELASGNNSVAFGEQLPLPTSFTMLGTLSNDGHSAFISPLSHLTLTTAQSLPGGLIRQNIEIASQWLAQTFDLEQDLLSVKTPDLTGLLTLDALSDQQLKQAVLGASFYPLINTESWRNGELTLDALPLQDIFYLAADLAQQLAAQLSETQNTYASSLSAIGEHASSRYQMLASSPLAITSQPDSISIDEGESFVLYVQTTSDEALSYQWRLDGIDIPGATSASYGRSEAVLDDMGSYNVVVSNSIETVNSLYALVTVNKVITPVIITQQPQSVSIPEGDGFSLSVSVEGDGPFDYQWQKGGSIIPGATNSRYVVEASTAADQGSYRVVVRNPVSETSSSVADVIITNNVSPVTITLQPQPVVVTLGASATLRVEANGGGFISYQWYKNGNAINNAYANTLTIDESSMADAGSYSVRVTNSQGSQNSTSVLLTVLSDQVPVSIALQPQSRSVFEGESTTLNVVASGDGELGYQWRLDGKDIVNATQPSYVISSASFLDAGAYTVTVNNAYSAETSLAALVTVNTRPSVALSWNIPSKREDGSTLELFEIAGYVIEYGDTPGNLPGRITINDGASSQYEITDQSSGALYIRIATVDSDGLQGNFSELLAVTIP